MDRPTQTDQITAAIVAVMAQVPYVRKGSTMAGPGGGYAYASEADFIARLHPAMVAAGLALVPHECALRYAEHSPTAKGVPQWRAEIVQRWLLVHTSGQSIAIQTAGIGVDSGDKSAGKAATQAYKWALRQVFGVETGTDPDDTGSHEQAAPTRDELIAAWRGWSPSAADVAALHDLAITPDEARYLGVALIGRPPPESIAVLVSWLLGHEREVRDALQRRASRSK
jgi:hypothetical protein